MTAPAPSPPSESPQEGRLWMAEIRGKEKTK